MHEQSHEQILARVVIELVKQLGGKARVSLMEQCDDVVIMDQIEDEFVLRLNRDEILEQEVAEAVDQTKNLIIELESK